MEKMKRMISKVLILAFMATIMPWTLYQPMVANAAENNTRYATAYLLNTNTAAPDAYKYIMSIGDQFAVHLQGKVKVSVDSVEVLSGGEKTLSWNKGMGPDANAVSTDYELKGTAQNSGTVKVKFKWKNADSDEDFYSNTYFHVIDNTNPKAPQITLMDTGGGTPIPTTAADTCCMALSQSRAVGDVITLKMLDSAITAGRKISKIETSDSSVVSVVNDTTAGRYATATIQKAGAAFVKVSFTPSTSMPVYINIAGGYSLPKIVSVDYSSTYGRPTGGPSGDKWLGDNVSSIQTANNTWCASSSNYGAGFSADKPFFIIYRLDSLYEINQLTINMPANNNTIPPNYKIEVCAEEHAGMNFTYDKSGIPVYYDPNSYKDGAANNPTMPTPPTNISIISGQVVMKDYFYVQQNWKWTTIYGEGNGSPVDKTFVAPVVENAVNFSYGGTGYRKVIDPSMIDDYLNTVGKIANQPDRTEARKAYYIRFSSYVTSTGGSPRFTEMIIDAKPLKKSLVANVKGAPEAYGSVDYNVTFDATTASNNPGAAVARIQYKVPGTSEWKNGPKCLPMGTVTRDISVPYEGKIPARDMIGKLQYRVVLEDDTNLDELKTSQTFYTPDVPVANSISLSKPEGIDLHANRQLSMRAAVNRGGFNFPDKSVDDYVLFEEVVDLNGTPLPEGAEKKLILPTKPNDTILTGDGTLDFKVGTSCSKKTAEPAYFKVYYGGKSDICTINILDKIIDKIEVDPITLINIKNDFYKDFYSAEMKIIRTPEDAPWSDRYPIYWGLQDSNDSQYVTVAKTASDDTVKVSLKNEGDDWQWDKAKTVTLDVYGYDVTHKLVRPADPVIVNIVNTVVPVDKVVFTSVPTSSVQYGDTFTVTAKAVAPAVYEEDGVGPTIKKIDFTCGPDFRLEPNSISLNREDGSYTAKFTVTGKVFSGECDIIATSVGRNSDKQKVSASHTIDIEAYPTGIELYRYGDQTTQLGDSLSMNLDDKDVIVAKVLAPFTLTDNLIADADPNWFNVAWEISPNNSTDVDVDSDIFREMLPSTRKNKNFVLLSANTVGNNLVTITAKLANAKSEEDKNTSAKNLKVSVISNKLKKLKKIYFDPNGLTGLGIQDSIISVGQSYSDIKQCIKANNSLPILTTEINLTSDNPDIVAINADGNGIIAKRPGIAKISAKFIGSDIPAAQVTFIVPVPTIDPELNNAINIAPYAKIITDSNPSTAYTLSPNGIGEINNNDPDVYLENPVAGNLSPTPSPTGAYDTTRIYMTNLNSDLVMDFGKGAAYAAPTSFNFTFAMQRKTTLTGASESYVYAKSYTVETCPDGADPNNPASWEMCLNRENDDLSEAEQMAQVAQMATAKSKPTLRNRDGAETKPFRYIRFKFKEYGGMFTSPTCIGLREIKVYCAGYSNDFKLYDEKNNQLGANPDLTDALVVDPNDPGFDPDIPKKIISKYNNSEYKTIQWKSNDPNVAVVDAEGRLYPTGDGTALITARAADGVKTAQCNVHVQNFDKYISLLDAKIPATTSAIGSTINGNLHRMEKKKISLPNIDPNDVVWFAADPNMVFVDQSGKVTAVNKGNTKVYAISKTYGTHFVYDVTVYPMVVVAKVDDNYKTVNMGRNNTAVHTVLNKFIITDITAKSRMVVNGKTIYADNPYFAPEIKSAFVSGDYSVTPNVEGLTLTPAVDQNNKKVIFTVGGTASAPLDSDKAFTITLKGAAVPGADESADITGLTIKRVGQADVTLNENGSDLTAEMYGEYSLNENNKSFKVKLNGLPPNSVMNNTFVNTAVVSGTTSIPVTYYAVTNLPEGISVQYANGIPAENAVEIVLQGHTAEKVTADRNISIEIYNTVINYSSDISYNFNGGDHITAAAKLRANESYESAPGGGGSGSSGPRTTIPEAPKTMESTELKYTITQGANGEKAAVVEPKKEVIETMIKSAQTDTVDINVNVESNITNTTVKLDPSLIASVKEAGKKLEINTGAVRAVLEVSALNIGSGASVSLQVQKIGDDTYDFNLVGINDQESKKIEFSKSMLIKIMYDVNKVQDPRKLGIYYYNETSKQWEYVGGKATKDGYVECEVSHFSQYAVKEGGKTFTDMADHWAKPQVDVLAAREIISGLDDQHFGPESNVTRAQFAAMLVRAMGYNEQNSNISFSDVKGDAWYKDGVVKAAAMGIVKGADGQFNPESNITREEMAVMIVRALKFSQPEGVFENGGIQFEDHDQISDWAADAVGIAVKEKLINGMTSTSFGAKDLATRSQAAVLIYRLLENLNLL